MDTEKTRSPQARKSGSSYVIRVLVLALGLLFPGTLSADFDDPVVRVGVYENPPKIFTDSSGKPAGIFIDILEYIAKQEGWKLLYIRGSWAECLQRLEQGAIDVMPDVAWSAEREKVYSFHKESVLSSWYQVYARKNSGIHSILDLNGRSIAFLDKSVQQAAFEQFTRGFNLQIRMISLPDYESVFRHVADGKVDAGVTNQFFGAMHARRFDLMDTAVVFEPSSLFFATRRGENGKILAAIDRHLQYLKKDADSAYYRSRQKWTSEELPFRIPSWFIAIASGIFVVLLISAGGSLLLKRQVNARTFELRQINAEMEQRILARTAELAEATEKARSADRIKSAFLATMSHELRTPLNSIIGFTGILLQGLAGPLNDEQRKQLEMVQSSARHLLLLINDVLDISKIEAGQLQLSYSTFHLRDSIDQVAKAMLPLAEKGSLALVVDISEDVGEIESDRRRLEQVILNLVNNAIKFTEHGQVRICVQRESEEYLIRVTDTGIGIKPGDIPQLFIPFHQIDSGIARKREGTGLGLSICIKVLDMLGGTIHVDTEWGRGSTFSVRIPTQRRTPS